MDNDIRYLIFGRSSCTFCALAVDYCKSMPLEYVFCDYETRQHILEDYKKFYDQETVPIILENNKATGYTRKVGGYSELIVETKKEE
jgi:glutaredoxin